MKNIKEVLEHIIEENEKEFILTEELAQQSFNEFNKLYFNNELKPIKIELIENSSNDYGDFNFSIDYINKQIESESITLDKTKITNYDDFRNILVHEMIHYYINEKYKPDESIWNCISLNNTEDEILDILGISDNMKHKGKWKIMADKLTQEYEELFIENKKDDFEITTDFIENFKNTHKLYFINDHLFVLKIDSEKYKLMQKYIETGKSKLPKYTGDLYELILDNDIQHFDYFIIYSKHLKEDIYNVSKIVIDRLYHESYFDMKFVERITTDLDENVTSTKLSDIPKEILEELNILHKHLSM